MNPTENMPAKKPPQSLLLKIGVPLLIVLAIAGLWLAKNKSAPTNDAVPNNPDFALEADSSLDLERLKSYGLPILLDFSADWCAPCKEMEPILRKLNQDLQGKAIIKIVNTEELPAIASQYPVTVIPTQFLFDSAGNPYGQEGAYAPYMKFYSTRDTEEHVLTAHEGLMYEEDLLALLREMGLEA
ncbi:thioredoxin [Ruminococcaceae bacterium OttesenSCG-928-L11]|nr:thioredoxin [Ruminococcaceae bacterium OttesenSCG-928-L11]